MHALYLIVTGCRELSLANQKWYRDHWVANTLCVGLRRYNRFNFTRGLLHWLQKLRLTRPRSHSSLRALAIAASQKMHVSEAQKQSNERALRRNEATTNRPVIYFHFCPNKITAAGARTCSERV